MYLPGDTTLSELHEIQATCRDCCTLDGCDDYCPYWRFSVDDYCCAFGHLAQPLEWNLPTIQEMED